jgi:DNA-binding MarR family transcriptional regulator
MDSDIGTPGSAPGTLHVDTTRPAATQPRPRRSIDMDILPELLGYNVRCAQLVLHRSFVRSMGEADIGTGDFGLLVLTGANPGIAQIEVATHLNVDKASVVSMVDKLEKAGWLLRRRAMDDRRRHGLFLTAEGTRQLRLLKSQMAQTEDELALLYSPEERRLLIALLQRIRP